MASRPLSIIVSVKTLRPEVDDYWLLIPTDVQTIADLKRHVMSIEAIDCHRHQDVDLWLADGVLRDGNTSVGDILQNRDRIEMRAKSCGDKRFANRSAGDNCESDADSEDSRTTYTVSKCTPKTSRNGSKQTSLASGVNGSMDELFGSSVVDGRKDPDDSEPSNWTKHLVDDNNSDDEYYSMIHTLGANRTVSKKSFNTSDSLYDDCMDQTLVTNRSDHSLHKRLDARQTPSNTVATDGHTFTTAPVDSSTPVANHSLNNTVTMTTTTGAPMTPPETPPEVISDTCDGRRCSTTVSCVESSPQTELIVQRMEAQVETFDGLSIDFQRRYFGLNTDVSGVDKNSNPWYKDYIKGLGLSRKTNSPGMGSTCNTGATSDTESLACRSGSQLLRQIRDKLEEMDGKREPNDTVLSRTSPAVDITAGPPHKTSISTASDRHSGDNRCESAGADGLPDVSIPVIIKTMAVLMDSERKTNGGFTFAVIMSLPLGTANGCPLEDNYELQMQTLDSRIERTTDRLDAVWGTMGRVGVSSVSAPGCESLRGADVEDMSAFVKYLFPFPYITVGPKEWVDRRNARLLQYLLLKRELAVNMEALSRAGKCVF